VARPKVNFRNFYSVKSTKELQYQENMYVRERRSKEGSEGTQDPVITNRLPSSSTRGLATNAEGKSIQVVRKISK
jgi:hypothetical protein